MPVESESHDRRASVTPSRSDPLRVGLIGTGYIGNVLGSQFHAHDRAAVGAVCDPNTDNRTESAARYAVPESAQYADHETMLDGEALDAVVVGSPHTLHYEQILAGLDRGLHVFCDKPLTTDLEEAKEVARRADESDTTTMIGYQRHLNPAFIRARERWQGQGDSNPEVRSISASITQNWISRFADTWRTNPDLSGGGNLYDTGSHLLDAVLWTTGLRPIAVSADMDFADDENRVDERANVLIRFEGGATADVSVFSDAPCVREHIHVWDDEGAIYLEGREWEPRELTEISADSTDHTPYIDRDAQQSKADAFLEAISENTDPPATVADALRVTAVTEAAYESARSGDWIDVDC